MVDLHKNVAFILAATFLYAAIDTASAAGPSINILRPAYIPARVIIMPPYYRNGADRQHKEEAVKENQIDRNDVTSMLMEPSQNLAQAMAKPAEDSHRRDMLANIYWACGIETKRKFNVTALSEISNTVRGEYRECVRRETQLAQTPAM